MIQRTKPIVFFVSKSQLTMMKNISFLEDFNTRLHCSIFILIMPDIFYYYPIATKVNSSRLVMKNDLNLLSWQASPNSFYKQLYWLKDLILVSIKEKRQEREFPPIFICMFYRDGLEIPIFYLFLPTQNKFLQIFKNFINNWYRHLKRLHSFTTLRRKKNHEK